eukprot:13424985-Alexandrium_andersonii.AAC.1
MLPLAAARRLPDEESADCAAPLEPHLCQHLGKMLLPQAACAPCAVEGAAQLPDLVVRAARPQGRP